MTRSGRRILLVGCGELGSRHLQAVATLPEVDVIEVVDPRPEALATGRRRLEGAGPKRPDTVRWLTSLDLATPGGDLCIVATMAGGRSQLLTEIATRLGFRRFLLEKIVAQSVAEYERMIALAESLGLAVWVNCKTRAYPFHLRVKQRLSLNPDAPILLTVVGGNHGLVTNGVHAADLFAFFDDADLIEGAGSSVDPVLHPSKRGTELFELSGTLQGRTAKGSRFVVSLARNHQSPDLLALVTSEYRCIVDHLLRQAMESDAESGWQWRPAVFENDILVSQMTGAFVSEILDAGTCRLPTLSACLVAHRFVLTELLPHFNALMKRDTDRCPVT